MKKQKHAQYDGRFGSVWVGSDLTKFAIGIGIHGLSLIVHIGFLYLGVGYLYDRMGG